MRIPPALHFAYVTLQDLARMIRRLMSFGLSEVVLMLILLNGMQRLPD